MVAVVGGDGVGGRPGGCYDIGEGVLVQSGETSGLPGYIGGGGTYDMGGGVFVQSGEASGLPGYVEGHAHERILLLASRGVVYGEVQSYLVLALQRSPFSMHAPTFLVIPPPPAFHPPTSPDSLGHTCEMASLSRHFSPGCLDSREENSGKEAFHCSIDVAWLALLFQEWRNLNLLTYSPEARHP